MGASPYPAAKLMELGQAEALRMFDHHDRCIRDINAHLDYGSRNQYLNFAGL